MLIASDLLTILGLLPGLLRELDAVNAVIHRKAESLQCERKYERSCPENSRWQSKNQETSHHQPHHPAPGSAKRPRGGFPCRHGAGFAVRPFSVSRQRGEQIGRAHV